MAINKLTKERILELITICPFDLKTFIVEEKELLLKYLRKDTRSVVVDDWDKDLIPEAYWYKNTFGILKSRLRLADQFTLLQKLEWVKCALDCVYFTRKYVKIVSIDDGVIPFNLYDYQEELLELYQDNRFVLSLQSRQSGKMIDLDTPILTPTGFVRNGDLKLGDTIYGRDGKETTVVGISPKMKDARQYAITFSNGETIKACSEHCWLVNHDEWDGEDTVDSDDLFYYFNNNEQVYIEYTKPILFNSESPIFLDNIDSVIPPEYIFNSIANRRYLLESLIAKGVIRHLSENEYACTHSEEFNASLRLLLSTLGIVSTIENNELRFDMSDKKIFITSMVELDKSERVWMQCLTVNNEDHTFLCGESLVPTHNTQVSASFILWFSMFNSSKTNAILANKADQAQEILDRAQQSYNDMPLFLQPGVSIYNKRTMKFGNGSKMFSAASSSASIRGRSCVVGNTKITVRNKHTGLVEVITMNELKQRLEDGRYDTTQNFQQNSDYEVLTPDGWSDFDGLVTTHDREVIRLLDYDLICTPCHKIKIDGKFVRADYLRHETLDNREDVYDLFDVKENNQYFTNDVVSHNCSLVYIDEAAFIPNDMVFYESTYPVISSGRNSRVILTTTPNGTRGMFYKLWIESKEGKNSYKRLEVPWYKVPGRDEAWKQTTIANTSEEQFAQEFELAFRGSSNTLISNKILERIDIAEAVEVIGHLRVFKRPERGRKYVITVDVSEGVGKDYHAATVIDVSKRRYEVVAVYHENTTPTQLLPDIIEGIAANYNDAWVCVEAEKNGIQVAYDLYYVNEYENVFLSETDKSKIILSFGRSAKPGVKMSKGVKAIGCSTLKSLVDNNILLIRDSRIVDELGNFIPSGASYAAAKGCNDDLVMTLVLFAWLSNQSRFIDMLETETNKDRLKDIEEYDVMPFGIIDNGMDDEDGIVDREAYQEFLEEDRIFY